jgi:hypothetical protein
MVEDTQKIIKFRRLHHVPLALFHKQAAICAQRLSILSLGATQSATNFFMVARVLNMKEALKQIVIDVEWDTYVRTLLDEQKKPVRTQGQEVRRLIVSDDYEFWQSCANYYVVMKATMVALKEFNSKHSCICNVNLIMGALRHHLAALRNAPFNMPGHLVDPLKVALKKKKALAYGDLHYLSVLYSPHLIHDIELYDDQHAMAVLMKVFQKLFDTDEEFQTVKVEFNLNFHTMSPYCGNHVWSPMGMKEEAYMWWFISGCVGKLLPHIARRILVQVVSSSSS